MEKFEGECCWHLVWRFPQAPSAGIPAAFQKNQPNLMTNRPELAILLSGNEALQRGKGPKTGQCHGTQRQNGGKL